MMVACSPDDYDFGGAQYSKDDLKAPDAYTVTVNGNRVNLVSKINNCTPLWILPTGVSEDANITLELPFAGDYEVTFGAETRNGPVYGEPYKFNLAQNDFSMLSDEKWFYLADEDFYKGSALPDAETLAQGVKKRWYPCDKDYGLGCTAPMMYMSPYDIDNDGKGYTEQEETDLVYKDIPFGRENWAPNWDPGFQDWLYPNMQNDSYLDSYMEFSMDAANGCVATMYRGESGTRGNSTGTNMKGKFNLSLTDKTKPLITFTDCYAMHNIGFDEVCANYTRDIQIIELTPYYLSLVTKRTNSEGNWYIVWNYVSEEVVKTNGACIPKDEGLIEKSEPVLPEYDDVLTQLFSVESNGVTYLGNQITYILNEEQAYDWLWWNGSPNIDKQKWESVTGGKYDAPWAPMWGDDVVDYELILEKKEDPNTKETYYAYTAGDTEGKVTIEKDKLIFDNEISILTAANDMRTVEVKGKEFQILKLAGTEELVLGVPESKDENGNVTSYLVANFVPKAIGGGQTGPIVAETTDDFANCCWTEKGSIRVGLWSTWSGVGLFKDVTKVKLKKNQTIKVTLKVKPGVVTWDSTPKCALITNLIPNMSDGTIEWEPKCFEGITATDFNINGETTLSLTNTTGSTVTFTSDCLMVAIQYEGIGGTGDCTNMFESVTCVIE